MNDKIDLLRSKIGMLDTQRKTYVAELIELGKDYGERIDLWLEYSIKADYPKLDRELLGDNLVDFISCLEQDDEYEKIVEEQIVDINTIIGIIYENFIDVKFDGVNMTSATLSESGINLLEQLIKYNVGSIKVVY